jgi:hypothetical protein
MQNRRKTNPLTVVFFLAAFGFTYLVMPYILEFFNIDYTLELLQRIKKGTIFIEFVAFVVVFLAISFLMEIIFRLFKKK